MAAVVAFCSSSTGASAFSSMREPRPAPAGASSPSVAPRQAVSFPATFVGVRDGRLAVFRSRDGSFARNLTDQPVDLGLPSVTPNRTKVFYVRVEPNACVATYVVPLSGGESRLARGGTHGGGQPIAAGPSGALAGNYACIASMYIVAKAGNGQTYYISGTRDRGADGMAWAPDAKHLAVSTITEGVLRLDVTADESLSEARRVPCPALMASCTTHAPSYAPGGTLYYVAVNAAATTAKVVRLVDGQARPVFTLPQVSAHFSLAAAAGGHVLVSGDADSSTMTRSNFVVRWNGSRLVALRRAALQVDW
jgi:Tol biopolymer transport system component